MRGSCGACGGPGDSGRGILRCTAANGAGISIGAAPGLHDGSIQVNLVAADGARLVVRSEPGLLPGSGATTAHLAVVIDNGPQMMYFVKDGRFCDGSVGGSNSTFGYRFFQDMPEWNEPGQRCDINASRRTRLYGTFLTVSELVRNNRVHQL